MISLEKESISFELLMFISIMFLFDFDIHILKSEFMAM